MSNKWVRAIEEERIRQIAKEGWTAQHDDSYTADEIALAAVCYTLPIGSFRLLNNLWPWGNAWWKPTTRKRNLVKAGALIVAELERLERAEDTLQ